MRTHSPLADWMPRLTASANPRFAARAMTLAPAARAKDTERSVLPLSTTMVSSGEKPWLERLSRTAASRSARFHVGTTILTSAMSVPEANVIWPTVSLEWRVVEVAGIHEGKSGLPIWYRGAWAFFWAVGESARFIPGEGSWGSEREATFVVFEREGNIVVKLSVSPVRQIIQC